MAKRIFGLKTKSKAFKAAFGEALMDAAERLAVLDFPEDGDADAMGTWATMEEIIIPDPAPTRSHTGRKLT